MHIRRIEIENVRSIARLVWQLPEGQPGPGWHVILGDNGSGKSTFLQATAMALMGPRHMLGLRQGWDTVLRHGTKSGEASLSGSWAFPDRCGFELQRSDVQVYPVYTSSRTGRWSKQQDEDFDSKGVDGFTASFGPMRRFTGGDPIPAEQSKSLPVLARHLSLFEEDIALPESLNWLTTLRLQEYERLERNAANDGATPSLLARIRAFVNHGNLLPTGVRMAAVNSDGVHFLDAGGFQVRVTDLSQGFRSVLSLTFELIRQLAAEFGPDAVFDPQDPTKIVAAGIVLIDEIDAHLHPTWQRQIGPWFRAHFPNVQFLVTTHSPLICQAAEVGSVFKLPTPGTEETGRMLEGVELQRVLYGDILDAFSTGAFGPGQTRSEHGQRLLRELAELNVREVGIGLTDEEAARQEELRRILPTRAARTTRDVVQQESAK